MKILIFKNLFIFYRNKVKYYGIIKQHITTIVINFDNTYKKVDCRLLIKDT